MVSFELFVLEDGIPIYLQIISWLKRGMVAGTVRHGDELPSRRVLSALLGVNPNTVQKAYRILEEEGLIASQSGAKSTVVLSPDSLRKIRRELLEGQVKTLIAAMTQMGLSKEEALGLVDKFWQEV